MFSCLFLQNNLASLESGQLSHNPQMTFKSILFGKAIRLRHLNQRNDDYFSSLNRLKEKAIRLKISLEHD